MIMVSVTTDDIAKGKRLSTRCCPVALAIRRSLRKRVTVGVDSAAIYRKRVADDNIIATAKFPAEVTRFIYDFDDKRVVQPFDFVLETVKEIQP